MASPPPYQRARMKPGSDLAELAAPPLASSLAPPRLLVEPEPRHLVFLRNLRDTFAPAGAPPLRLTSHPAPFWNDVFVASPLPWRRFLLSSALHLAVASALWAASQLPALQDQPRARTPFHSSDVIYFSASEYLPPLDTGGRSRAPARKGEPAFAKQPILSVPANPDNSTQTIVTPPRLQLEHDMPLPNIVAWAHDPIPAPIAAAQQATPQGKPPVLPSSAIAPPPDVQHVRRENRNEFSRDVVAPPPDVKLAATRTVEVLRAAVVAPAPQVETAEPRRISDISIGHSDVIAPAPQLPMEAQRTFSPPPAGAGSAPQVVPPPPPVEGATGSRPGGNLIVLGIHPSEVTGPVAVPAGNRRGSFAATPQGKLSAPGTPDLPGDPTVTAGLAAGVSNTAQHNGVGGSGNGGKSSDSNVPAGLYVGSSQPATGAIAGKSSSTSTVAGADRAGAQVNPRLLASAAPLSIPHNSSAASPVSEVHASEVEKQVFGPRRFYSMRLNMPNLNSAGGGSWIVRFAELKQDSDKDNKGELIAPLATHKVDPAYPAELMRRNVQGTVTLYAVIHSDGRVGEVKVLSGIDDRLDQYALAALERWRFQPATRNGSPVDLEAVIQIPFRVQRPDY